VASHHAHHAVSHKAHAPPEPEVDARDVIGDEDSEILQRSEYRLSSCAETQLSNLDPLDVWHQASAAHARASHVHAAASRAHSAASSAWRAVGSHNRAGAHAAAATEHHHIAADHGASATFYHQQGNLQHPAVSANHAALSMHDAHESEQMGGHSHNAAVASYNDAQHRAARRH